MWHSNGTMSYSTRKVYTYVSSLSGEGLDPDSDVIVGPNVPVLSAYYQMRDANFAYVWGLQAVLYSLQYKPWASHTPTELVWGYQEPMFGLARMTLPNPPPTDKFGFFTDVSFFPPAARLLY